MSFGWPAQAEARRKDELRAALAEHAHRDGDRWWFSSPAVTHSEEEALRIVEACQLLGMPVTDMSTSETWLALMLRVVELDKRVQELEQERQQREDWQMELRDRGE